MTAAAVPAVAARGLTHRFGEHLAVGGTDLTVRAEEVFGLLGPNGAGKTTTLRIINALLPVQDGSAEVFGYDVGRESMSVRRLLGYVPQQLSIEAALTGRENVTWFARLFDVPRRERAQRVSEVHDRTELLTRAVQPMLWLIIFGETFNRIHAIPSGGRPYLDFLAPGIIAQSGMFIAIFYGIQIIWERDAGMLTKLLVTPTPRSALIFGKSFAAGIRSMAQVVVVLVLSALLGVTLTTNPLHIIGAFAIVMLGAAFFSCLSMTDRRHRAQARPADGRRSDDHDAAVLRFQRPVSGERDAGLAARPEQDQPAELYEVDALRGMLIGTSAHVGLDFGVMVFAVLLGVATASSLVGRLAR